ncbi:MAG TPA: hypothetical protein VHL30_03575 [Chlamydiales bacterium]|jgi:hypothetical protein|nr:hypothetical protein [Chlamydiales bacterium]
MTKIGDNDLPPKVETKEKVHQDLEASALKFENALQVYRTNATPEEKTRLKAIMDTQLALIKQAVDEIKLKGMNKQELKVEDSYKKFTTTGSDESYAALENDLQTLRDYNKITDLKSNKQLP